MKTNILTWLCVLIALCATAQVPHWGFRIGSSLVDEGYLCKAAPNGNVYLSGKFSGTIDVDPGPTVHNITSAGLTDAYLACFDSVGNFQWGFAVGGSLYDGAYGITVDKITSDVYICGFYQGSMDCDPGPGAATLFSAGGTGLATVGDGFIAKYSAAGVYQWAKSLGGSTVYDHAESLETDSAGNVYVGGEFNTSMTISPSITFSSAAAGPGYIIKYSSGGTLIWGHNFGQAGIPGLVTVPRTLVVSNGYLNVCGVFKGTANFNPWGAAPATVTASGGFAGIDGFVTKYDTAGNFVFLQTISGSALDDMTSLTLDPVGNIYVTGYSASSSVVFNAASPGSSTVAPPSGAAGNNIVMAKYSTSGAYQWGKIIGGPGDDMARLGTCWKGSDFLVAGWFSNTVDFDPSAGVASLASSGGSDIFLARYDFSGNYVCAFGMGSSYTDDHGCMISHDLNGNLYYAGQFGGTVDFDPSAASYPLTSAGSGDAFLVRYRFPDTAFTGSITGSSICSGDTAFLTITITSGPAGPYTITLSNGTSIITLSGVISGVPFIVSPSLSSTVTYTVTAASFAGGLCNTATGSISGTATVTVTFPPAAISGNTPICAGGSLLLSSSTSGGVWSVSPISVASISSSGLLTAATAGTATVLYANSCGSASVFVTVNGTPGPILGNVPVCPGAGIAVTNATPGGTWSCTPASVATISSGGIVTGVTTGTATITYNTACGSVYAVVTVNGATTAITGNAPICVGDSRSLTGSPAGGTWSVAPAPLATITPSGLITGMSPGTAVVSYNTACGTATVIATINATPGAITGNAPICDGNILILSNTIPGGSWTCSPASVAAISSSGAISTVAAGTATVTYTTACGSAMAIVTVSAPPVLDLGPDITICPGLKTKLIPSGASSAANFLWSTHQTTSYISVDSPGTYWVSVTENGCNASDTITVSFKPIPTIELGADTVVCTETGIAIGVTADTGATYGWNTGSTISYITVTMSGTYALTVRKNGCIVSDTRTVIVINAPPYLDLGADTTLCSDEQLVLRTAQESTKWSTGASGKSITISEPGVYWASIRNECGETTDTIIVTGDNCDIWFPGGFTPNGDGLNDIARIRGSILQQLSDFTISIYNRWGERVFFSNNIYDGWDGVYNSKKADVGVYFYMIKYTRKGKGSLLKGDLTLIR